MLRKDSNDIADTVRKNVYAYLMLKYIFKIAQVVLKNKKSCFVSLRRGKLLDKTLLLDGFKLCIFFFIPSVSYIFSTAVVRRVSDKMDDNSLNRVN